MELFAVPGLPEIRDGDDLAAMIDERVDLREGDVVVVASTVVSKAEGGPSTSRTSRRASARRRSPTGSPKSPARKDPRFAQAVIEESTELIMEAPFLPHCDPLRPHRRQRRNRPVERPRRRPTAAPRSAPPSARRAFAGIAADRVVVSDTCGRPFRHGQRGSRSAGPGSRPAATGAASATATAARWASPSRT